MSLSEPAHGTTPTQLYPAEHSSAETQTDHVSSRESMPLNKNKNYNTTETCLAQPFIFWILQ